MGGVTGLDGSGFDRGAGLIGHQFIAGTKKPAHGGLECIGLAWLMAGWLVALP